ncbi:MAG: hypothetical protein H0X49_15505 [Acidobacteria bacterium]|jgi:hypothetical protein|nr:hypothetical protein [Acidobacteriota bacterium]
MKPQIGTDERRFKKDNKDYFYLVFIRVYLCQREAGWLKILENLCVSVLKK